MPPVAQAVIRFDRFELDPARALLTRDGIRLKLQPQPFRVLLYLVTHAPHIISREELGEHIWPPGVHVDLDPGLNYCVRQIRQLLDDSASVPRFIETLPRQGYRFIGTLEPGPAAAAPAPSPAAQAVAALAEATHAGALAPSPAATPQLRLPTWSSWPRRRRALAAIAFSAVIATAFLLVAHLRPAGSPTIRSLAVLPLENLSGDPAQTYFADGLTDELITVLAQGSTLRIPSRTSVMQYKGVHRPLREIARELDVDAVLEGSVIRSGDHVHLNLQLSRALTDAHLWAESYDRDTSDLVGLPRDAALSITRRLGNPTAPSSAPRVVSAEAHDAYLRGRYLWFNDKTEKSAEFFRRATDLQPDYALGWSGLSIYYGASAVIGTLSPEDSLAQAEAAGQKAVDLDDSLAEAHLALGSSIFLHRWDWARATREIDRAIALDPRFSEAYHFRAKMLAALGKQEEAITAQRRATELDPFARPWALGLSFQVARRFAEAHAELLHRLESNPTDTTLLTLLASNDLSLGNPAAAVQDLGKAMLLAGDAAGAAELRRAFSLGGEQAVRHWQLARLQQQARSHYVSPVSLASLFARLGEPAQALALLEQALLRHAPQLLWIECDPAFDSLHADPRYQAVVRRIGLPASF